MDYEKVMRESKKVFSVKGVDFLVHKNVAQGFCLIVFISTLVFVDFAGNDIDLYTCVLNGIVFGILFELVGFIHELGHIVGYKLVKRNINCKVHCICSHSKGKFVYGDFDETAKDSDKFLAVISFMGPVFNLITLIVSCLIFLVLNPESNILNSYLIFIVVFSAVTFFINMLPYSSATDGYKVYSFLKDIYNNGNKNS